MSPVREVSFIVARELRKSFRSVKGILLALFTVVGGGLLAHLLAQSDEVRKKRFAEKDISAEQVLEVKQKLLGWLFTDAKTGDHVGHAPLLLAFLFQVSLWLIPAVVLVLGFESISGDLQHKTARYWTLRSRRSSYVVGKFFGLWGTCGTVALAMHVVIWGIIVIRGEAAFGETVSWGFRFWLASLPIIAVWCAVSVSVSSLLRHPILALLLTAGVFFMWWLVCVPFWLGPHLEALSGTKDIGELVPPPTTINFLFPSFYDRYLLSPMFSQLLLGLGATLGFAALLLSGSSLLFAKRDI